MAGGVTIRDMQELATSIPDIHIQPDFGNIIEIGTEFGGDDLGLLANTKLMNHNGNSQGQGQQQQTIHVQSMGPTHGISEVDITNLEPIRFDVPSTETGFSMPAINIVGGGNVNQQPASNERTTGMFGNFQSASGPAVNLSPAPPPRDAATENKEKIEFINKLARLEKKGFPVSRRYTLDNTLEEIKGEYLRLVDARNLESSIKTQRSILTSIITGLEWMNKKFDPFELELDGWSEAVDENIDGYDDIFEELYDKYKDKGQSIPPEIRLAFAIGASGVKIHMMNSYVHQKFGKQFGDDVLRNNPELARQFAAAVSKQAGGEQPSHSAQYDPNIADPGPGAFFGSSSRSPQVFASQEQPPVMRREMKGPSGVDDILRTFEEVRSAKESSGQFHSTPTAQAAVTASEIRSQGSTDTERTGRPRRRKVPVENSITLNV